MSARRSDPAPLDQTLSFMQVLWRIEHSLQCTSKMMRATLGITGPQRLVLRIIERSPDESASHLSTILRLHPSTLTGILQRLQAKRLIVRTRHPADNRRARLRITPAARPLISETTGTVEAAIALALRRQPPARLGATRKTLEAIADALERFAPPSSAD